MTSRYFSLIRCVFFFACLFALNAELDAQLFKKKNKEVSKTDSTKLDKNFLKSCTKMEGLFDIYQDSTNGSAYLSIKKEQLDKEFIYFSYSENGPIESWHVRGMFRENKVFTIRKHYEYLEFVTPNISYYYDDELAISKGKGANTSEAIWASLKIEKTKGDSYIVKADDLFLMEKVAMIKPPPPKQSRPLPSFSLGKLSKEKTKYHDIRNYPKNTEVMVDYVYDNPTPYVWGSSAVTDARYVSIRYQHSFIEMPDDGYTVRYDDPRVGYFYEEITDLTSTEFVPYRDLIHRWRLIKKDPTAEISEPEKPITFWMENTTPKEWRPIIKEAVERWNIVFEDAGFKNAVVVKQQPDDAEWDAGDIRYNVLRWCSSPRPPWGGYGPSFVNPRTGEIIGADVMLEYSYVFNRASEQDLFVETGARQELENLFDEALSGGKHQHHNCIAGHLLSMNNAMGAAYVGEYETDAVKSDFVKQSLGYLMMHEVGHTLGLAHNMKSSHLHSPEQLHDTERTGKMGLYGSVMEYPTVNLALDKSKQGHFYTVTPGTYDRWAIRFGYDPDLDDEKELKKHLDRSTEPELFFGNDADDMRSPGGGIDPRVMIFDLSSDPLKYGEQRVQIIRRIMPELAEKFRKEGESYNELYRMFRMAGWQQFMAMNAVSRYIGGIYQDRGYFGQEGAGQPLTPVKYSDQKKAMNLLQRYIFSPSAFRAPDDLLPYLMNQRRGWNHWRNNDDPQLHDRYRYYSNSILNHLLHPVTLKRMTDSRLYGNKYSSFEMMSDLTKAIFEADLKSEVNSIRQMTQLDYLDKLINLVKTKSADQLALSAALAQINAIEKMATANKGSGETKAHREHLLFRIEQSRL